ncbi:MAG: YdcF family protein, partial [Patescibacteria group bacterium]|nr:YdcF family protein [Patescibacteria group bacterium]
IVVLSAGIKRDKSGKWVSTDLIEAENFAGAPGGKARVMAASYIYKENPESFIVASGGHGSDKNIIGVKHPRLSKILKRELEESGVPDGKIIEENKSRTTYQQLLELQKITVEKGIRNIIIISNRYHLPRIRAMIKYGPGLNFLKKMLSDLNIKLISAENLLIKHRPGKWKKIIEKAYKSKDMIARIKLERKGVEQIKRGTYKFR